MAKSTKPLTVTEPLYPEHEKLALVQEQSQTCGEFIDWLADEHGLCLCERDTHHYRRTSKSINELLAGFFKIDQKKLEAEKQDMLANVRRANQCTKSQ